MKNFQNIYVEEDALQYDLAQKIIAGQPDDTLVKVKHYKDVFCRPRQNYNLQSQNQCLILAVKHDDFVYPGAEVCQDFGFDNFYYSSCVMNCVCDCEYCYLKGMYPSGNLVVFVNIQDYFEALKNTDKYICVSYDTDLFPLESLLGFVKKWCDFACQNPKCTLEIRTKCKNLSIWNYDIPDNVIFAFSLSPQQIIDEFEHKTSSLKARIENIVIAQEKGHKVRLCFDPIIYTKNWKENYSHMLDETFKNIDAKDVEAASIGSFRISNSYLKNMRKIDRASKIVNFPFCNVDGYYQYQPALQKQMENFVHEKLCEHIDEKKVFLWK